MSFERRVSSRRSRYRRNRPAPPDGAQRRVRLDPALANDLPEHLIGVGEQLARLGTDDWVLQNPR